MGLMTRFLRFFFRHFYHEFAWSYDFVAAVVSIGRWNQWIDSALPFVQGRRVLEIGHGPGHLQEHLRLRHPGLIVGLDESPHMGRLSRNRLLKAGIPLPNLTRALAQSLPFQDGAFDVVVSTFPAEYIFEHQTMHEVRRVLDRGRSICGRACRLDRWTKNAGPQRRVAFSRHPASPRVSPRGDGRAPAPFLRAGWLYARISNGRAEVQ